MSGSKSDDASVSAGEPRLPSPRPDLAALEPYRSSATRDGRIFLHANESPYPLPAEVAREIAAQAAALELNRYPDPEARALVDALATYVGVERERVLVGDGSNEVLLQACLAYGGRGRTALLFEPSYVMHQRQARMAGTQVEVALRTEAFAIDVPAAVEAIERVRPDVVFVCSPNNPTGTVTPLDDVAALAAAAPGLVILDEAYAEFTGESFVPRLDAHPNVIIVRTLSKAFRLAAVRLGYALAHPGLLDELRRVRLPYGQSAYTQLAAEIVVRNRAAVLDAVPAIVAERERVAGALAQLPGVTVFPSGANFVFFRHPDPAGLLGALSRDGIVIRDFSSTPGCPGCLRVTIGASEENDAFLAVASAHP